MTEENTIENYLDDDIRYHNYPSSILVRVAILNYLKISFFGMPVGQFKYGPDDKESEILIKDSWTYNDAARQKKPSIVISRGPMTPLPLGLNNNMLSYNVNDDSYVYSSLLTTNITIECLSSNDIESETIANTVFSMLLYYWEDLRKRGLHKIDRLQLGNVRQVELAPGNTKVELFGTPINFQAYIEDRMRLRHKTEEELQAYYERTGVDPRGVNTPPVTMNAVDIGIDNTTFEEDE